MEKIAKFEKVSFDEYKKALEGRSDEEIKEIYDGISLPRRATKGSAGYDFYAPYDVTLLSGESVKIPTGIRVKIADGWVLALFPRSGLGFKFRLQLDNTVGIIDADYYESDNQGHIFCKITNDSRENKTLSVKRGNGFCQGIFLPFGITTDDETTAERNGGFGSTDK
ncbi:MAG: dUTP diphosphatase [Christensenellales bacterium]